MNYLKELKAFRDWLLLNDLNTSGIALWHTLMTINNMTGWKERFNAPNSTVEKLTGLSKQGLVDARKKLLDNGLIEYEKGKKGKAPIYKMISLVNSVDSYPYQSACQSTYQSYEQSADEDLTIPKQKQNKTKIKTNNLAGSGVYPLVEQYFGMPSEKDKGLLNSYLDDLGDELVIEAMKRANAENKRLSYAIGIMKDWFKNNVRSLEDVQRQDNQFEQFKQRKQQKLATGGTRYSNTWE